MKEQIKQRTKKIGIEVIKLIDELPYKASTKVIASQILRSATSIGANYRISFRAKSNSDYINKLKIVEEEADETLYWLELLKDLKIVVPERIEPLKKELNEILSIIVVTIRTLRSKQQIAAPKS
jgi:four helix bundle protein